MSQSNDTCYKVCLEIDSKMSKLLIINLLFVENDIMAKKNNEIKQSKLSKFRANFRALNSKQDEISQICRGLIALSGQQLHPVVTGLDELLSEFSVTAMMVGNNKKDLVDFISSPSDLTQAEIWQTLNAYFIKADEILMLVERTCAIALANLAVQPMLHNTYKRECERFIENYREKVEEVSKQLGEQTNLDLKTLYTNVRTIRLPNTRKPMKAKGEGHNPVYAVTAKLINREINKVGVTEAQVAQHVLPHKLARPHEVSLFNINCNGLTIPAVFREASSPSDECIMFISGAGDHGLNSLDNSEAIAEKLGCNYLVVNHNDKNSTHFAIRLEKLIAGVEYLMVVKNLPLEKIKLIGHSNGGRLALEAADYLMHKYQVSPQVVLNNTYETLSEVSLNIAKDFLVTKSHRTQPSLEENSFERVISRFAKNQLDNAFAQTATAYNAEEVIKRIGYENVANIYTGVATTYDKQGRKLTKNRDQVLGKGQLGRQHNQRAKQDAAHHELIRSSFELPSGDLAVYKDKFQAGQNSYLNVKLLMSENARDIHNEVNVDCIVHVIKQLSAQQAIDENALPSLQLRLISLLKKEGIDPCTRSFATGLELNKEDLALVKQTLAELSRDSSLIYPTQGQLMNLFQADGEIGLWIASDAVLMQRLLTGDGSAAQQQLGLIFLGQKMSLGHLRLRHYEPDGQIDRAGSYLTEEQIKALHQKIAPYEYKLKRSAMRLPTSMFVEQAIKHKRNNAIDFDKASELEVPRHKRHQALEMEEEIDNQKVAAPAA